MKNFKGEKVLLDKYNEITKDINQTYKDGTAVCFAGSHGLGKTLVLCSILKVAANKNYSCLYVTLSDIISNAISNNSDRFEARKELLSVDFLVIDEFDPRHIGSDKAAELFGRQLEDIFRKRVENKLPTFMGTNSPNVIETFTGDIKASIESLMNYMVVVPVIGKDFRKTNK
jgi:DNA replication protein DnaC